MGKLCTIEFADRRETGMKNVLKLEMEKALKNRMFLLSLIIGIIPAIMSAMYNILNTMQSISSLKEIYDTPSYYIEGFSLMNSWMGGEAYSLGSAIFFYICPLIVALPYGWSYCEEKRRGYRQLVITKCGRRAYVAAKYMAVFCTGGLAIIIPLLLNLLLIALFIPMIRPFPSFIDMYGVTSYDLMSELYFNHPLWYIFSYILLDFIFGGLIACLAFVFSAFVKYKVLSVILPMFVCLGINYIENFIYTDPSGHLYHELSPLYFLRAVSTVYPASWNIILTEGCILLFVLCVMGVKEAHCEIY